MANLERRSENPYSNFVQGLKEQNLRTLDDREIRERIGIIKDLSRSSETRQQACAEIYGSAIRLVPPAIQSFAPKSIPPEELIGEGFETIRGCIKNFNPDYISPKTGRPVDFSTYVFSSLKYRFRSPRSHESMRSPFHENWEITNYTTKMVGAYNDFCQREKREPSNEEWHALTNQGSKEWKPTLEIFKALKTRFLDRNYVRIGQRIGDGEIEPEDLYPQESLVDETIGSPAEESDPFEIYKDKLLREAIADVLDHLTSRERRILNLRYGLLGDEPMTYDQIAEELGITGERVRQLEAQSLRKLRYSSLSKRLRDFLE